MTQDVSIAVKNIRRNEMTINVMVDLETLGTTPGCVILSLAAVPFSEESDSILLRAPFYKKIAKESCEEYGLFSEDKTIAWWEIQSAEARKEAFSGTALLPNVLLQFSDYLNELAMLYNIKTTDIRMWGNGASFDIPVLEAAYRACDMAVLWRYSNSLCYRTMKKMFPQVAEIDFGGMQHNALFDALHQAEHLRNIFAYMHGRKYNGNNN